MTEPMPPTKSSGKTLVVKFASFGAGFALTLAVLAGALVWYSLRPRPPKTWDSAAIVATKPPSFSVSDDGKNIELYYTLENTTDTDFEIDSNDGLKIVVRTDDTISQPLSRDGSFLKFPIFVPTKQKVLTTVSVRIVGLPERHGNEAEAEFDERLRSYLDDHWKGVDAFTIFESRNRYQINLPKWESKITQQHKTP